MLSSETRNEIRCFSDKRQRNQGLCRPPVAGRLVPMSDLYHHSLGFPRNFRRPTERVGLIYTRHALDSCRNRGVPILKCITLSRFDVIEIEVEDNRVIKYLVRGTLDIHHDIVLAIIPQNMRGWVVKTSWVNSKNDHHSTLDISKYRRP